MAVHFNLRDVDVWTIRTAYEILGSLAAVLDDFSCIAPQEYLAYSLLIVQQLRVWEVPGRVEGFGECQMLFCNDPSRDALLMLAMCIWRKTR
jgi:hypothetical protein